MEWDEARVNLFKEMSLDLPIVIATTYWPLWVAAHNAQRIAEGYSVIIHNPQEYCVEEISWSVATFRWKDYLGHNEYNYFEFEVPIDIVWDESIIEKMYEQARITEEENKAKLELEKLQQKEIQKADNFWRKAQEIKEYERLHKIYGKKETPKSNKV